ncbi:MAG: nucleotidyltransferase family protein [Deltaproteobacteria bacterium]|jgi:predicted nucleotidyltransferase|nr:nucleotidyltransferase family protein [Deltaproteobacteria bacterium]
MKKIETTLKALLPELKEKYHIKKIGVFGSYSRGDHSSTSDVDILVEFSQTIDLFTFAELKLFLSEQLSKDVDLVTPDAIKKRMKERIFSEVAYI